MAREEKKLPEGMGKAAEGSDFRDKLAAYMKSAAEKGGYVLSSEAILKMAEEELLKRGVIQKQEWSEEERVRKEIVSIVKAYRENCIDEGTHRFDDCLSWLEKQEEQKPAEWSEEYEERLDSIIESYKELLRDYKACHDVDFIPYNSNTVVRNVVDDVRFLKSLRPQPKRDCKDCAMFLNGECTKPRWKPSEEQMEALERCVEYLEESDNEDADILAGLYEQLKAL